MINLNETVTTYDLAEALAGETGKFEVTTPSGERLIVTCSPAHSVVSVRSQLEGSISPFRIRKIAEFATRQQVLGAAA